MPSDFNPIFTRLRAILRRHVEALSVAEDTPTRYVLEGGVHPTHRRLMPIAWVQVGKAYVSFHLMPIYGCPELSEGMSGALAARMQGKSCFNFTAMDEVLFRELERLTTRSIAALANGRYPPAEMEAKRPRGKLQRRGRT
jgi:hypothetical protein